jgi:hypothetical protein
MQAFKKTFACRMPVRRTVTPLNPAFFERRPLGDGRGRASGDGWGPGFGHAIFHSTAAADGWREGCLQAGALTATRGGRREAVSVTAPQPVAAQDDVIFN